MQIEPLSNKNVYITVFRYKGEKHVGVKMKFVYKKVYTEVTLT